MLSLQWAKRVLIGDSGPKCHIVGFGGLEYFASWGISESRDSMASYGALGSVELFYKMGKCQSNSGFREKGSRDIGYFKQIQRTNGLWRSLCVLWIVAKPQSPRKSNFRGLLGPKPRMGGSPKSDFRGFWGFPEPPKLPWLLLCFKGGVRPPI